jgi:hypothetical protein
MSSFLLLQNFRLNTIFWAPMERRRQLRNLSLWQRTEGLTAARMVEGRKSILYACFFFVISMFAPAPVHTYNVVHKTTIWYRPYLFYHVWAYFQFNSTSYCRYFSFDVLRWTLDASWPLLRSLCIVLSYCRGSEGNKMLPIFLAGVLCVCMPYVPVCLCLHNKLVMLCHDMFVTAFVQNVFLVRVSVRVSVCACLSVFVVHTPSM